MDKPTTLPAPPTAPQRSYSYERHGETIDDPWHWIRDPKYPEVTDPDVLAYLHAENDYFESWAGQHRDLIDGLFEEMKGRIKEDDRSVPIRDGNFLYWWAFTPGAQYRTWYRKPAGGGADQVIFDEPVEAEGKDYFRLGALEVSPDGRLAATLTDADGSERFHLNIRDLATGKDMETVTEVGIGQPVWTSDSAGIVFTEVNDNWRSYRARYHRLGANPAEAVTLYDKCVALANNIWWSWQPDASTTSSWQDRARTQPAPRRARRPPRPALRGGQTLRVQWRRRPSCPRDPVDAMFQAIRLVMLARGFHAVAA